MIDLTKDEKSFLLYAETCAVDKHSCLEGMRMNNADMDAAKSLEEKGILSVSRLKSVYIKAHKSHNRTHFVSLTGTGWKVAWELRYERAMRQLKKYGPTNTDLVRDIIPERKKK